MFDRMNAYFFLLGANVVCSIINLTLLTIKPMTLNLISLFINIVVFTTLIICMSKCTRNKKAKSQDGISYEKSDELL